MSFSHALRDGDGGNVLIFGTGGKGSICRRVSWRLMSVRGMLVMRGGIEGRD